ncbi:SHOCT domain-containing protein [Nocardiopsis sp. HNM0947]|uniref:SHOCT domain-containing protein n=1 Tax=Nocardiopsis coralli TaxID=2772213 RepID=A0ABR9P6N4_9ACTN|nr:SHOCT domain-containing protein [Nocardiopsis coralli]MBE2999496.1 SHOCT domain-containing protein [Nocardiopsis coralli]
MESVGDLMAAILVLFMLAMGVFVAVTVSAAAHAATPRPWHRGPRGPFSRLAGPEGEREVPAGMDPALAELRMRYARGEIGREEFLQRKIDLE